jgi:hypothetical protein
MSDIRNPSQSAVSMLSQAISIFLLLLHFYYFDYDLFYRWGLTARIGDELLTHIWDTGLFANFTRSKLIALLFLGLSLLSSRGRKDEKVRYRRAAGLILGGVILFFGSSLLFMLPGGYPAGSMIYILLTSMGFILLLTGGSRLSRVFRVPWPADDPFGRRRAGFPQEERLLVSKFSLHLKASYTYKGKQVDSWINLINPRRGVLIMGSPGSGKSWFIIEPMLCQLMAKGFAVFIYDFKYDTLTQYAYFLFRVYKDRYPDGSTFCCINFTDLRRSHRCNLLAPYTLDWMSDAIGASRTILLSMNKTWIHHQGEFFVESPINFLAALIWFLRKYRNGEYCTLPHAIELAQVSYDRLFPLLESEPEIQTLINPFVEAYANQNFKLLDSQIASARIPLGRLASPDLYYVLTGNDFSLGSINDPEAPKIFCLGGDPPRQEALAPVLSLYIDRLNKLCNRPGRHPLAIVCDEFATVRAYSMTTTIATARSNNIVPILAVQDLSQLRTQYSRDEADLILNITGNLICGQVGGDTAGWVSERFPKVLQERATVSANSYDTSISKTQQWEAAVTPATVSGLSSGEFLGIVADDPGQEIEFKAFHAKLAKGREGEVREELPFFREIDAEKVMENFLSVKADVRRMVLGESGDIVDGERLAEDID